MPLQRHIQIWLTLLIMMGVSNGVKAQLQTNSNVSAADLVQNTLMGPGVIASNIQYSGHPDAIGYFNGANTNIGLGAGVLINTGTVNNQTNFGVQEGPFGPNDEGGSGIDNGYGGNNQLQAIAGGNTFNAAVLEFDFIPTGDTVRFRYVFASEEYLEFVNAGYNDVFAFFISGPGIGGQQNIARVPGSNIPVTIDNVNAFLNSNYYVDNGDGNSAPQNSDWTVVQYDGFTTVLEAVAAVQPCQTYHIRLAIADVGDGIYDSGVFLEAASFTSEPSVDVEAQLSPQPYGNDTTLAEGCSQAQLVFTRTEDLSAPATFDLIVSGTATPGVDCEVIPASITFPAGSNTISLPVTAYPDGLNEGSETLRVTIVDPGACTTDSASVTLIIRDVIDLTIDGNNDTLYCDDNGTTLNVQVNGGIPSYYIQWSDGSTGNNLFVNPSQTTTYDVTVTDFCGNTATTTLEVFVDASTPLMVSASKDTTLSCPGLQLTLEADVLGGTPPFNYQWSTGSTSYNSTVSPTTTTTYTVTVTDRCGQVSTDSVTIFVDYTPITLEMSPDLVVCPGDPVQLYVTADGGRGDYNYAWNNIQSNDDFVMAFPQSTTVYTVEVTDSCGTFLATGSVTITVSAPTAAFTTEQPAIEQGSTMDFVNLSTGAVSYYWDLGNGTTGTGTDISTVYDEEGDYEVMLIAYNEMGCADTAIQVITIHPPFVLYVPNAFTPDGDGINDRFAAKGESVATYEMIIFDRWGKEVYRTTEVYGEWDGTLNGRPAPIGVYVWRISAKPYARPQAVLTGHVTLVR